MPSAAPSICNRCSKSSQYCKCVKRQDNWGSRQSGTTTARGYGYAWRKRRAQILKRDKYLCQQCLANNRLNDVSGKGQAHIDHKIPKHRGGTDEPSNLWTLCVPCHREKTSKVDSKGGVGQISS